MSESLYLFIARMRQIDDFRKGGHSLNKEVGFNSRDRLIELGLTIAALRKMRGMSQEMLAEKAKISRSHLSSIEAPNIVRPFSIEVLYNIADALDVRAGDLLNSSFPATGRLDLRLAGVHDTILAIRCNATF